MFPDHVGLHTSSGKGGTRSDEGARSVKCGGVEGETEMSRGQMKRETVKRWRQVKRRDGDRAEVDVGKMEKKKDLVKVYFEHRCYAIKQKLIKY